MTSTRRFTRVFGARRLAGLVALAGLFVAGCAAGPPCTITDLPPGPAPYELKTKDVRKVLLVINHIALRNDRAKYDELLARQNIEVTQGARDTVLVSHGQFPEAASNLARAMTERLAAAGRVVARPPATNTARDLSVPRNAREAAEQMSADTVMIADIAQCAYTSEDRYYTSPGPRWSFISLRREFAVRVTIKVIDTKTGESLLTPSLAYSVVARVIGEGDRERVKREGIDIEALMNWDAKVWPGVADAFIAAFKPPERTP